MFNLTMIDRRSLLLQVHLRNLLSRIMGISKESKEAITTGIEKQWIRSIEVYGLDDKNLCHVGLILIINWKANAFRVLVVEDSKAIDETVSTKDDLPPAVVTAIIDKATQLFNQAVAAGHRRIEWYPRYEQGLDPLAIDKELGVHFAFRQVPELPEVPEFPEVEISLTDFSLSSIPSEHLPKILQYLYVEDVLTQSSQRSARIQPIPVPPEPEPTKHVQYREITPRQHIADIISQASPPGEPTQQDKQAKAIRQHVEQLREEAKIPRGVIIYQRGALPKNYETHAKQFAEALGNQQHRLRQPAEHALQRFAAAAAKEMATDKGLLIQEASQRYGIPASTLADWVDLDLIPVLSRSKKAVYLDEEAVAEAAPIYRAAKELRVQPARLLKERRAQERASNPQESR
jgi:hypothetical protein